MPPLKTSQPLNEVTGAGICGGFQGEKKRRTPAIRSLVKNCIKV